MIKTFLIVVLSLTLTAGAFLSRPTESDFRALGKDSKGMVFCDRYLWVQVEDRSGKVQFTGLFAHWLERGNWVPKRAGAGQKGS